MTRPVRCLILMMLSVLPLAGVAQTGFYIPGNTRVKDMSKALCDADQFALLLEFGSSDTTLSLEHLDWLDSAYGYAFNPES